VSVIVFLGPTLPRGDAEGLLDADYRPPAAFGDVFRAARERPSVIGIVDGYFEGRPAVWHKEILWALSEGVHVFGAASIGALRAAELASFGMVGVGRIFEDYAKGALEDDDDVAVSHGPAETGYLKINEPMVNVRATLLHAAALGIVDEQERLRIEQAAKSIYYKDRTYQAVLREAERADVAEQTLRRLETWLPAGQVDQKRLDAMDLLRAIAAHAASDPEPKQVDFRLSQSAFWQDAQDEALKEETAEDDRDAGPSGAVDELRFDPGMYRLAQRAALGRVLALREADRQDLPTDFDGQAQALAALRCREGLASGDDILQWMSDNGIGNEEFRRLVEEEAKIAMLQRFYGRSAGREIETVIVEAGLFPGLATRAQDKEDKLAGLGDVGASTQACGLDDDALLRWFVGDVLRRPVVASLGAYAGALGFASEAEFRHALAREYCYVNGREG